MIAEDVDLSRPSSFARRLPHNVEAEQALLGAIMVDNRVFERVADTVLAEHFVLAEHVEIYRACSTIIGAGHIADPITLKAAVSDALSQCGGPAYLIKLADSAVTRAAAADYAKMIHDLAVRRSLIALGEEITDLAYQDASVCAADQIVAKAGARLDAVTDRGSADQDPRHISEAFGEAFRLAEIAVACREEGRLPGLSTGIKDIDELTYGLHKGELTILAGRPSSGKSELAINLARNIAAAYRIASGRDGGKVQHGGKVVFYSLEMRYHQLAERIQAQASRIGAHRLRGGQLSGADLAEAAAATLGRYGGIPLYIDDRSGLSVATIRASARRAKRKHGLDLIIIDYLQLIAATEGSERYVNDNSRIEAITRDLKRLAKDLDVPVVCLSQLSRAVEQRDDKRPQMSDLRSSGAIEQDADNIAFVYRESYYLERAEPTRRPTETDQKFADRHADWQRRVEESKNVMEVIYAKQRMGPIRSAKLYCDFQLSFIGDLEGRR